VSDALESRLDGKTEAGQFPQTGIDEVDSDAAAPVQAHTRWAHLRRPPLLAVLTVATLLVATLGTLALVVSNNRRNLSTADAGPVVKVAFSMASLTTYGGVSGLGRVTSISCAPGGQSCTAAGDWRSAAPHKISASCPSETSCITPFVLRYGGGTWRPGPAPAPISAGSSVMSLSCPSAQSCDAIVLEFGGPKITAVLEHFNGSTWSMIRLPSDLSHRELGRVSCRTVSDCYLAGLDVAASGGTTSTGWITQRLDGHWLALDSEPDTDVADIGCESPTSCWAVGAHLEAHDGATVVALHFADGHWETAATARPRGSFVVFLGVACANPSFCVAVGDGLGGHTLIAGDVVEVLKDGGWTMARGASIAPDQRGLFAVACGTYWGCIAVGGAHENATTGTPELLAVAADGSWRQLGHALPSYGAFESLSCVLPTKCFTSAAVGIVSITAG
jgi:hypothetical protein